MLLLALVSVTLSAQPRGVVRPAPIFLVLRTATSPTQSKREVRLHDEVSLLLDNFAVLSQNVDDPVAFQARPLAEQLKQVLELASHNEALGVLWLAEPVRGQLMVYVVGIGSGRALIRTLEFDQRSGSEKGLALIVRELLGTAFLQAEPESIAPSLAEVVRDVRRQLPKDALLEPPAPAPVVTVPPRRSLNSLGLSVISTLSLVGAQGRWLSAGGQLRGEHAFGNVLALGLEFEMHGARDFGPQSTITSLEVPLGLTASASIPVGAFFVVPRLSVLAGVNQLWARNAAGSASSLIWVQRNRLALGVRTESDGPVQVMLEVGVDALPLRAAIRDSLTGADLWRAPWLEMRFAAGVLWKG